MNNKNIIDKQKSFLSSVFHIHPVEMQMFIILYITVNCIPPQCSMPEMGTGEGISHRFKSGKLIDNSHDAIVDCRCTVIIEY